MSLDPRDFRRALGKFATGVTVVTALDRGRARLGVTASSFNTVSIDPPLVLWSIEKRAYSAEVFTTAENFVINVLASDQVDISNRFARRGEDKFSGVQCSEGIAAVPRIDGAVAHFECRTWNVYDGGDHHIIVAEVLDFRYDEERNSLVFHNGRYAIPEQHPVTRERHAVRSVDGALGQSLIYLLRQAYSTCSDRFYPKLADHGVTAEEWRILTLLRDRGAMNVDDVGAAVMQPPKELRDTVAWLCDKGLLQAAGNDVVELTANGDTVAQGLLRMASELESKAVSSLSGIDIEALKAQLREIAGS